MQERIQDFDTVNLLQSTVPEASASFEEALVLGRRRVSMERRKDERKKEGMKEGKKEEGA